MVAHFPSLIYQVKNLNLKEKMWVTKYCIVYSASASAFWASQEHLQIIVSAWVLIAPSPPKKLNKNKPQLSHFFSPQSTEKMNKFPHADKKARLTITFMLISE